MKSASASGGSSWPEAGFLSRNPRAALTVDLYSDEREELAWVQILGEAQIVQAADAPAALASLIAKYRSYRESLPAEPVIAIEPQRCRCWHASAGCHPLELHPENVLSPWMSR